MRLLLPIIFLLIGCTNGEQKEVIYSEGIVLKTSKEFTIPKSLKTKIQEQYVEYVRDTDPSSIATAEELISQLPREFLEVNMYLQQLNPGTLSANTVFRSPRGGGLIDLSQVVDGEKGSFFVRFEVQNPQDPDQPLSNLKTYYLSEVQSKEIDNKVYGSGCNSVVDISKAVRDNRERKGFRVNAKDDRYLHTMAGTYIFVSYTLERILLAALRVKDSSVTGVECPGRS